MMLKQMFGCLIVEKHKERNGIVGNNEVCVYCWHVVSKKEVKLRTDEYKKILQSRD